MRCIWGMILLMIIPFSGMAQSGAGSVSGIINGKEDGKIIPLVGVSVYWSGTTTGTRTDEDGKFNIKIVEATDMLIVSYIGYKTDTLKVTSNTLNIVMNSSTELDEVVISHRRKSTEISMISSIKVENIGERELQKAACCNLSESFETSPGIDVAFTDAVTGARQIQMLGLAGPYVQMTRENIPDMRGLASIYGMELVPGTWIESIQLNKGPGSVVNGFESISGQINIELRKPENSDKLYFNLFANSEQRLDANLNMAHKFDKWSTAVLLHGKYNSHKFDMNHDTFMDMPVGHTVTALNRWEYNGNGIHFQAGIKGSATNNEGGQFDGSSDAWKMDFGLRRFEGWAKLGKVFADTPWKSFGFQVNGVTHRQNSIYGYRTYDADQQSLYFNFIYQSIIGNTNHGFKTGVSWQADRIEEQLADTAFNRTETVPGLFFEYTWTASEKLSMVAGLRADYHNIFGFFMTPRLHLRYAPFELTVLRISAGRGQRTAGIIAENSGVLASSRQLILRGDNNGNPYGFDQEVAWNYGINLTQKFMLASRVGSVSFDFYRTDFSKQIVLDLDQNTQEALFFQLQGKSYSNSFQAQFDYELFSRFDFRLAYRRLDVKTDYINGLERKPLQSKDRIFMNLAYETGNKWLFDYTINWQGSKRIPFTGNNPSQYRMSEFSPDFVLMNAQVTKKWSKLELYVGGENLADYKQHNPIIASDQPFSPYFDSSLVWGPIFGRMFYAGLRYRIL